MNKFIFWDFDSKKHIKTDKVLQMSATDISMGQECEWKLYFKYTKVLKPKKNIYLVMGSVFHSVIEQDLKYFVLQKKHKTYQDLKTYFESEWSRQIQNCDMRNLSEIEAKNKCLNYITNYYRDIIKLIYPLNIENIERFFRTFITYQGQRLGITGKVDLIDKSLFIVDHKTSSRGWTQEEANKEFQAQIYPYCLKSLGLDIRGFKFNVVNKQGVNVFTINYDTAKVKDILIKAFDTKKHLEEGNMFRAKSQRICKFCEYNSICKEKLG